MNDTQQLIALLERRMASRNDTLTGLIPSVLDSPVPDQVKQMREMEASRLRAVIQEQSDIIELIKALATKKDASKKDRPGGEG